MSTNLQHRRRGKHQHNHNNGGSLALPLVHDDDLTTNGDIPASASSSSPRSRRRRRKQRLPRWCGKLAVVTLLVLILLLIMGMYVLMIRRLVVTVQQQHPKQTQPVVPVVVHLPIPHVDIQVPNATEWPLIHIVNTRFMQEQGPLEMLGLARFYLFVTFCFPTMISQSSQNFFWIIKTDPQFTKTNVFQQMIQLVEDYPNIYLVASNENYLIQPQQKGSWRDGAEGRDLLSSTIYTGNITDLHQAIALREERPILETRLDADDGLHLYYIQYIQMVAIQKFIIPLSGEEMERKENNNEKTNTPRWLYWCSRRHIEWHSSLSNVTDNHHKHNNIYNNSKRKTIDTSKGILNPVQHDRLCVTPGITVGYNVGVDAKDVPVFSHDLLYTMLVDSTDCFPDHKAPSISSSDESASSCLDLVEDLLFCALRSRTWTSAGMQDVPIDENFMPGKELTNKLWQLLEERFAMNQTKIQETQSFLVEHQQQIAYENLLGQCTTGHSCKKKAKQELQQYIQNQQQHAGGNNDLIHKQQQPPLAQKGVRQTKKDQKGLAS